MFSPIAGCHCGHLYESAATQAITTHAASHTEICGTILQPSAGWTTFITLVQSRIGRDLHVLCLQDKKIARQLQGIPLYRILCRYNSSDMDNLCSDIFHGNKSDSQDNNTVHFSVIERVGNRHVFVSSQNIFLV